MVNTVEIELTITAEDAATQLETFYERHSDLALPESARKSQETGRLERLVSQSGLIRFRLTGYHETGEAEETGEAKEIADASILFEPQPGGNGCKMYATPYASNGPGETILMGAEPFIGGFTSFLSEQGYLATETPAAGGETAREYTFGVNAERVIQTLSQIAGEQNKNNLPPWATDFQALPVITLTGRGLEFVVRLSPLPIGVYLGRVELVEKRPSECEGRLLLAEGIAPGTATPHDYIPTAERALKWGRGVLAMLWEKMIDDLNEQPAATGASPGEGQDKFTFDTDLDKAISFFVGRQRGLTEHTKYGEYPVELTLTRISFETGKQGIIYRAKFSPMDGENGDDNYFDYRYSYKVACIEFSQERRGECEAVFRPRQPELRVRPQYAQAKANTVTIGQQIAAGHWHYTTQKNGVQVQPAPVEGNGKQIKGNLPTSDLEMKIKQAYDNLYRRGDDLTDENMINEIGPKKNGEYYSVRWINLTRNKMRRRDIEV